MKTADSSRYAGKPLLRVLECYVLRSIAQLPESDEATLDAMGPKLAQVYGLTGAWHEIIAAAMKLPENMPDLIREMWRRNQEIASAEKLELTPQKFAEMFVDQNLS